MFGNLRGVDNLVEILLEACWTEGALRKLLVEALRDDVSDVAKPGLIIGSFSWIRSETHRVWYFVKVRLREPDIHLYRERNITVPVRQFLALCRQHLLIDSDRILDRFMSWNYTL